MVGDRIYPVLVCRTCFELTGWLGTGGECDSCLRAAKLRASFRDPHAGWVDLGSPTVEPAKRKRRARRLGLARLTHPLETHRRAAVVVWLARVEPGETGPIAPEEGYEIEVARREQLAAIDGSTTIVRFWTLRSRFTNGKWIDGASSDIARRDLLVPAEFPASLPTEQLLEAWTDFRAAVDAVNRRTWRRESDRRELQRQADAAAADARRDQRGVADLLDES